MTNTPPPLPEIQSEQTREQIFTHSSVTARRRGEFEVPPENSNRDNEEWAHIGDQVVSLAVTDLIQDLHPRLRVGPTSKLRDRIKRSDTLAEMCAVKYGLHERLRTQAPSLKASPNVQVDVFKAYVGGLFREQGLDVVKQWLDPLFRPLIDHGYEAERQEHLVPGAAVPATTCSPPPQSAAPTPSPPGGAAEIAGRTNTARLRARTTRNSPVQTPSAASPPQRETDRPNIRRKRRGDSMREGGSRDADASDSRAGGGEHKEAASVKVGGGGGGGGGVTTVLRLHLQALSCSGCCQRNQF
ncbi:Ribonuclease III domain containing protein [Lactarius tabidus]